MGPCGGTVGLQCRTTKWSTPQMCATCISPTREAILELLRKCRVDVLDGFVDFGGALVADGHAIDAGISEGKLHCLLPVFAVEGAFAYDLHRNHVHAFLSYYFHVRGVYGYVLYALPSRTSSEPAYT